VKAHIICNPFAGKRAAQGGMDGVVDIFQRAGWTATLEYSEYRGHAIELARAAVAAGAEVVLAAGGDGTINEVIQAIAGTETALGYLPYGTVNVWSRELGMPLAPERAAASIVAGRQEMVDLGLANGRYFLLMAGIGFDGQVLANAQRVERYKRRLGVLPYAAVGLSTVALYRGADIELRYDGLIRRIQALMLVVGNTRLYGGRYHLTPDAVANDGWLDLCIVKGRGPLALARQALPLLILGSVARSDVELIRVRDLTVQADGPVPMQLDGELAGSTPVRFGIAPRALRVIVPRSFTSDLIA
jgi:diacylglycerol kinase (ATP)